MTKAKKIPIAVIAIIMIPAVFLAGYFTGTHGLTFSVGSTSANEPVRDEADSAKEEIVDSVSEYLKPDASYSGSYREISYDEKMDDSISSFLDSFIAPLLGCGTNSNTLICGGYAKSFKALCNQFDIPCVIIYGESMGWPHCWNLVQMEDGKWYGIDVTNDDAKDPNNYQYHNFLKGSNSRILGENQFFLGYEDITKFGEANIPYDSNDYYSIKFPYPTISDEAYQPSN